MQYTDNEAALIGGLISTYFFQPAVSASLKDAYSRVLEHLHQNAFFQQHIPISLFAPCIFQIIMKLSQHLVNQMTDKIRRSASQYSLKHL